MSSYEQLRAALNVQLHKMIPITAAMQIKITAYNGERIRLQAPLAPNINDKQTGFAGSLAAIATISGWCLLQMKLNELKMNADIAVYQSAIRYVQPAMSDFNACTMFASDTDKKIFITQLRNDGKAKIALGTTVSDQEKQVLELQGKYVAVKR